MATYMTRRQFLGLACATGAGLALAACGGSAAPAPGASSPPAAASGSAAPSAAAGSSPAKPAASAAPAASKPATLKLTVVYTAPVAQNMPVWMAQETRGFADRGLTVEMQSMEGSLATKAMVAREMDVLLQGAIGMMGASLNGGVDLVYVASEINHSGATLNAAPGIQTGADLKGKIVGDDQPGTISDFQTLTMLDQLGLKPSDVVLRPLGASPVRTSSLLAGQVQAAALNPPFSFQVEAKGYKPLANLYKAPFLDVGAVVLRSRIDELSPALVAFVDACRDGVRAFNSQPDLALKVMQQYTKEADQDILHKTYDLFRNTTPYQEDQQPPLDGLQQMLDFLGKTTIPAAKTAKAEQFVDGRILARLPKH
jgi:ABC-type nitrate/sulfonate/bicarbonate transport system substrate-binding protein